MSDVLEYMRIIIGIALGLGVAGSQLAAQTAPAVSFPERMIRPAEYLKAPSPFPINIPAGRGTAIDSIRGRNLAPRDWGMSHVMPCLGVTRADTTGWAPIKIGNANGPAILPPSFGPDSTFRSYHGGLKWVAPGMEFAIENGWWGVPYDSAGYLTACRAKVRAGEYVVNETRTATGFTFSAFPWNPNWGPSTMVTGRAETEEKLRILWTAFESMLPPHCRYMTGSPLRDPSSPAC
jgi:hypothetical protein